MRGRKPDRKPTKRQDKNRSLSREALFDVLWESSYDPDGAFGPPWRSVAGPLSLVLRLAVSAPGRPPEVGAGVWQALHEATEDLDRYRTAGQYWRLTDFLDSVRRVPPCAEAELAQAGIRVLQLAIANSDGGGHAYNGPLSRAVETLMQHGWVDVGELALAIERARLYDALGPDAAPRRQAAFRTCWRAGRYALAYCV